MDSEWTYPLNELSQEEILNMCDPEITFNKRFILSENEWECTMLHEMCHYSLFMKGLHDTERGGHGPMFHAECERVADAAHSAHRIETSEEVDFNYDYQQAKQVSGYKIVNMVFDYRIILYMTKNADNIAAELNRSFSKNEHCLKILIGVNDEWCSKCKFEGYRFPTVAFKNRCTNSTVVFMNNKITPEIQSYLVKTQWDAVFDRQSSISKEIEVTKPMKKNLVVFVMKRESGKTEMVITTKGRLNSFVNDLRDHYDYVYRRDSDPYESMYYTLNAQLGNALLDNGFKLSSKLSRWYMIKDKTQDMINSADCEWYDVMNDNDDEYDY